MNTLRHVRGYLMTNIASRALGYWAFPSPGGAIGTVYGPPGCADLADLARLADLTDRAGKALGLSPGSRVTDQSRPSTG